MPSLSDKIHFYIFGFLIPLTCVFLSFAAHDLKATAALFFLWGGFGTLRFHVLDRAARLQEMKINEGTSLPSKLLNSLQFKKEKYSRENVRLFLTSGSFWVSAVFLLALGVIILTYILDGQSGFKSGWTDFFRDLAFLSACMIGALGLLSFIKQGPERLRMLCLWCLIWVGISFFFALEFPSLETAYALLFSLCALVSSWRGIVICRVSLMHSR